jgi:ABC-type antimicrobial peptide transport system permease subunit
MNRVQYRQSLLPAHRYVFIITATAYVVGGGVAVLILNAATITAGGIAAVSSYRHDLRRDTVDELLDAVLYAYFAAMKLEQCR